MAYYVEEHFNQNTNSMILGYWQPDGTVQRIPCATEQEAEEWEGTIHEDAMLDEVSEFERRF